MQRSQKAASVFENLDEANVAFQPPLSMQPGKTTWFTYGVTWSAALCAL